MLPGTSFRRHVTLWLLGLVAFINYVDRQAFSVVQDDIKAEFLLSDTMLSLIAGPGFALVYALAALPIARYADRTDRPRLIAGCLGIWSLATAACGLVTSAWQLLVARMVLAVGESGSGPAGLSLLTDTFSEKRRTMVIAFLQAGSSAGLSFGVVLASLLAGFMEWRGVFLTLGLPGLLLALVVWVIVQEPKKSAKSGGVDHRFVPLSEAARIVVGTPTLRWVAVVCIATSIVGFSLLMWGPSFLRRVHGFDKTAVSWLGGAIGLGLISGNLIAGWLGDRFGVRNPVFNAYLAAGGLALAVPFTLGFIFLPNPWLALGCFVVLKFFLTLYLAPLIALVFAIAPSGMRATLSALINALLILSGIGFGTFAAGLISDAYAAHFGDQSIRYALATVSGVLLIAILASLMAARTVRKDLRASAGGPGSLPAH